MATSVVFDLIDRLLAVMADEVPEGTDVVDGIGETEENAPDFLMIGIDDADQEGFTEASESSHTWAGLGNNARDEVGTISCYAESWNGDGNLAAARASVAAITAAVEDKLREDPNLGGVVAGLRWVRYGDRQIYKQCQSSDGAGASCYFQIAFLARL